MTDTIIDQINELLSSSAETPWVEFKENNTDPEMIGKMVSALSNSARLAERGTAHALWGIRDGDHAAIGTDFTPATQKMGNMPLEMWLAQNMDPTLNLRFEQTTYNGVRLVLLTIPHAPRTPIRFKHTAYIRVGSSTSSLSKHPEMEKELWKILQSCTWEDDLAMESLTGDDILPKLDYTCYFDLTRQPLPDNRKDIFEKLAAEGIIRENNKHLWGITNLGAILFAKNLRDFSSSLARKGVRIAAYEGTSRAAEGMRTRNEQRGYATGFSGLLDYIGALLPEKEHIDQAHRETRTLYPKIAVRELIANALIHQDMTITGAGPLVEIFSDRIEITNPGKPLVRTDRFLDFPPKSRNEDLASCMRRMGICEELGSGIDKVLNAVEQHQLPPPDFRDDNDTVRVTLHAPRCFAKMTRQERIRACYQHAALMHLSGKRMRNATLRGRLGIESRNAAQASFVIRDTIEEKLIKVADPERPRSGYLPFWA